MRKYILVRPLPDFLRHDAENRDNLNHDLNNDVRHGRGRPEVYVFFKAHEKGFHAAKQVDKSVLVGADILDSLRGGRALEINPGRSRNMLTWRRIPIPVKIAAQVGIPVVAHVRG
jgi:hypothetical protein